MATDFDVQDVSYQDGDQVCIGKYVQVATPAPTVLIGPDWSGINSFALDAAWRVADLGYNAFVMDIYGNGQRGQTAEEKNQLMTPFVSDRLLLKSRLLAAYDAMLGQKGVDSGRTAALGFCFGGMCALDLARMNSGVKGVVSFHGLLAAAPYHEAQIDAAVLVLHGHEDPMVPPEQVVGFAEEMTRSKADWQILTFGNTAHAFANPEANDASLGTVYHKPAAARAWLWAASFLEEVFA